MIIRGREDPGTFALPPYPRDPLRTQAAGLSHGCPHRCAQRERPRPAPEGGPRQII